MKIIDDITAVTASMVPAAYNLGLRQPMIQVQIGAIDDISAYIDTGADHTLATFDLADDAGLDVDEIKRSAKTFSAQGRTYHIYEVDIFLYSASRPTKRLPVLAAKIGFGESIDSGDLFIIGQQDLLQRLTFLHRNHRPHFNLRLARTEAP